MNLREKLLDLLAPTPLNFEEAEYLADYLIENGVTIQECVSVNDSVKNNSSFQKETPKRPRVYLIDQCSPYWVSDDWGYACPCCGNQELEVNQAKCTCGQLIDWSKYYDKT